MKYRLTFCILLLLFVAGRMSLIMAQTPQWITASESQSETNTWLSFKKDFVVSSVPQVLKACIAVDSKYWLWLNDKLIVFEGGVKRGPNRNDTYFDSIDLAPYLKQGDNTIAVLVWYFGKQGFSHNPSGQAALFFDAESPELSLVSDETWTAFVHPAYYTPLGEKPNFRLPESNIGFDANKDIEEWFLLKDKRTFQPAKVLGTEGCAPWNRLHPRIIPLWKDYGYADYRSVIRRQGSKCDTLICELPYNAQITPYFKVNAHKGDIISIKTDHYYGGGPANVRAEYIAKDGIQEYKWNKCNGSSLYPSRICPGRVLPCRKCSVPAYLQVRKERHACWQDDIPFLPSIGCNENHTVFAGMYVPLGLIGPVVFVLSLSFFQ